MQTDVTTTPLSPSERLAAFPKIATNQWHSALSMFPGVWNPKMASFRVSDDDRPKEGYCVIVDLDYHHDSALTRVFFSGDGEVTRHEFKATPNIKERAKSLGVPTSEEAIVNLADNVIRALRDRVE